MVAPTSEIVYGTIPESDLKGITEEIGGEKINQKW